VRVWKSRWYSLGECLNKSISLHQKQEAKEVVPFSWSSKHHKKLCNINFIHILFNIFSIDPPHYLLSSPREADSSIQQTYSTVK
jgi:hypothetical protein